MNKKKLLALLMALVMTLTLVPVTALADEDPVASAFVGGVETNFSSLEDALAAADKGTTVKLLSNIDYSVTNKNRNAHDNGEEQRVSLNDVTLDLQQHSITTVNASVVFDGIGTIQNGTFKLNHISSTGAYQAGSYALCIDKPVGSGNTNLALKNLELQGGLNVWSAVVTVENVTTETTASKYYAVWAEDEGTVVTINSGTFTDTQSGGKGVLATGRGEEAGAKIIVNGGYFNAVNNLVYNSDQNTIQISGGYFTKTPEAYLADDCKVVESDVDGYEHKVTKASYVAQINETGVKYESLQAAIDNAVAGDTVKLLADSVTETRISVSKTLTIDGQSHKISVKNKKDDRVIDVSSTNGVTLTLKNVAIDANECKPSYTRGISMYGNTNIKLVLDGVSIDCPYYAINVAGANNGVTVEVKNSSVAAGWAGINVWSPSTITVTESTISGTNDKTYNADGWNNFSTVVMNHDEDNSTSGSTISFTNCDITAETKTGNAQWLVDLRDGGITATFTDCSFTQSGTTTGDRCPDALFAFSGDEFENVTLTDCTITKDGNQVDIDGLLDGIRFHSEPALFSTYVIDNVQYAVGTDYEIYRAIPGTVQRTNDYYFNAGTFADKPDAVAIADDYVVVDNDDETTKEAYPYKVAKTTVKVDEGKSVDVTASQSSTVDTTSVNAEDSVKNSISQKTKVSGVVLTNAATADENKTPGLQAVVDEAKKTNANAIAEATSIEIDVKVTVTPTAYTNDDTTKTATFKLEPKATVTATKTENDVVISTTMIENVAVDNDMIDQNQDITVDLYTGFLPAQIIHRDDTGKIIDVFNSVGNDFQYDEDKKVATVTIHHFSTLEASAESGVAEINGTKFATLEQAFAAAQDGQTITLLQNVSLADRLFVNAGASPAYGGSNNRYATTSVNKAITLDMNGHNIDTASNIALAGGSLNITGSGTIKSTANGLAPVEIRGTGDLATKRTLTIGQNVILDGSTTGYGLNVFGSNDAQKNLIDVNVNEGATVKGTLFVLGNLKNTENEINIEVNGTVTSDSAVGIALNGYASVTVNDPAQVSGTTGIEVRAGNLIVNGGNINGTASTYTSASNSSGSATSGAGIAVAQHTTGLPITTTLNGGTVTANDNTKAVAVDSVESGTNMANISVTASSNFVQNQDVIPDGYEWKETTTPGTYKVVEKAVKILGGSLRKRATNVGHGTIVYNETDLRFGFKVTDYNANNGYSYYFTYTVGDYSSGDLTASNIDTDGTINLVLTKVPAAYYSSNITATLHVVTSGNSEITESQTLSVDYVANGLLDNTAWSSYAESILAH